MALIKWSPFKELSAFQEKMNQFISEPLMRIPLEIIRSEEGVDWVPSVDIFEDNSSLVLKAELPEMEMKDIDISVEGRTLHLKGERKLEKEEARDNYHRIERVYGQFSRSFTLPETVELAQIKATYDRGVLKITIPKKEEVKPKKIKVDIQS